MLSFKTVTPVNKNFMKKAIVVEKRAKILQAKALCTQPCKNKSEEDKSLQGIDGAGQNSV